MGTPEVQRRISYAAIMAVAEAEAAKEARDSALTETRLKSILAAAGLADTYHLDPNRNDDLDDIIDYGAVPLTPVTPVALYHGVVLSETKKALGVDENEWTALQQDVKKFLERGGGAGIDDNNIVAHQFLESGNTVRMGDRHFGILPGAEAEGLLVNEGGWYWGLEDEKVLLLIATIIAASKAMTGSIVPSSLSKGEKREHADVTSSSNSAEKLQLGEKCHTKDNKGLEATEPSIATISPPEGVLSLPSLSGVESRVITATSAVLIHLWLKTALFNNGIHFGPTKLLDLSRCNTLHGLFMQIQYAYRELLEGLSLTTQGICFFDVYLYRNSEEQVWRFDREGHKEWDNTLEWVRIYVEENGLEALDSLLEIHFDGLINVETLRYTNENSDVTLSANDR